jgi:hypothetical protein
MNKFFRALSIPKTKILKSQNPISLVVSATVPLFPQYAEDLDFSYFSLSLSKSKTIIINRIKRPIWDDDEVDSSWAQIIFPLVLIGYKIYNSVGRSWIQIAWALFILTN